MKAKGMQVWLLLAVGTVLQMGCAVGPMSWEEGKQAQGLSELSETKPQIKQTLPSSERKLAQPSLVNSVRVEDPGAHRVSQLLPDRKVMDDPNPLHPKGLWKGTLDVATGEKLAVTLRIEIKKAAFLRKKPESHRSGWSLVRSALACGPYGEHTVQPLSAEFQVESPVALTERSLKQGQNILAMQGEVDTMDAFRYSSNLRLEASQHMQVSAYIGQDPQTKTLRLYGSVFSKSEKGTYVTWGRFVLVRQ